MGFKAFIGGVLAVWKKNPWMTIDPSLAKSDHIWSHVPSWCGHPELRPPGVKAINDIFRYVARHADVVKWTVRDRVRIIGEVMKFVETYTSKADIDGAITRAVAVLGRTPVRIPVAKRLALRKAAHARVPAYEKLAAALRG